MKLKIRNVITGKRVAILVVLTVLETFLIPINAALTQGIWPSPIQVAAYATTAGLQAITLTVGLLEKV